jgi:hypothetical protein
VNSVQALGTDDWLAIVIMRIHRPSTRWFNPAHIISATITAFSLRTSQADSLAGCINTGDSQCKIRNAVSRTVQIFFVVETDQRQKSFPLKITLIANR